MSPEELARIVADLQAVVATAVPGGELAYGVASGDTGRLDASILTIAYDRGGRAIGFNALSLMDCELRGQQIEVLHLGDSAAAMAAELRTACGVGFSIQNLPNSRSAAVDTPEFVPTPLAIRDAPAAR